LGIRPTAYGLRRGRAAFTLIELLVVVALIATLSMLLTPAVRGLLGMTGPRGGVNTFAAALEQARLSAMENGVASYLGLPVNEAGISEDERYSNFIVFRDKRSDEVLEDDRKLVPVTRWLRLPQGVFFEVPSADLEDGPKIEDNTLPKLGTVDVSEMKVIKFDRFGKLFQNEDDVLTLKVGAKRSANASFGTDDAYFRIDIAPLTGRASVTDTGLKKGEEKR